MPRRGKSPAFQFYPDDFLGSAHIALMDLEQIGAYVLLLCHEWGMDGCSLPADDRLLARLARMSPERWEADKGEILACFERRGDRLVNLRLLEELEKQQARAESGRSGAEKRWRSDGKRDGYPSLSLSSSQCPPSPFPSPSPSPSPLPIPYPSIAPAAHDAQGGLFGEGGKGKKPRKELTPGQILAVNAKVLLAHYRQRYVESGLGGVPLDPSQADLGAARALVKARGLDAAKELVEAYLASRDPFVAGKGHPFALLRSQIPALERAAGGGAGVKGILAPEDQAGWDNWGSRPDKVNP